MLEKKLNTVSWDDKLFFYLAYCLHEYTLAFPKLCCVASLKVLPSKLHQQLTSMHGLECLFHVCMCDMCLYMEVQEFILVHSSVRSSKYRQF